MEQRDYFERYLDQFGRALAGMLARLTGSEYTADPSLRADYIRQVFAEKMDFDLDDLLAMNDSDLLDFLRESDSLNAENAELLANIILSYTDSEGARIKALILLEYALENSSSWSLELNAQIDELKASLH